MENNDWGVLSPIRPVLWPRNRNQPSKNWNNISFGCVRRPSVCVSKSDSWGTVPCKVHKPTKHVNERLRRIAHFPHPLSAYLSAKLSQKLTKVIVSLGGGGKDGRAKQRDAAEEQPIHNIMPSEIDRRARDNKIHFLCKSKEFSGRRRGRARIFLLPDAPQKNRVCVSKCVFW